MNKLTSLGIPQPQRSSSTGGLILQRLPLTRDIALRDLYIRVKNDRAIFPARCRVEGTRLVVGQGVTLSFDTYFGGLWCTNQLTNVRRRLSLPFR